MMLAGRGAAQLLTGGQILSIGYTPYFTIGSGFLLGLPVAALIALAVWGGMTLMLERSALGLFIRAIGINPRAARVAGVRARTITICVYAFCGLCAGVAGVIVSSNVKSADGNNAGPADGARRDPGRHDRRHAADRRPLHAGGHGDRRADHPDAHVHHLRDRRAARDQPGRQGGGGVRGDAAAVGRLPPPGARAGVHGRERPR